MGSMAEKKSVFVNGGNGQAVTGSHSEELERAQAVARR